MTERPIELNLIMIVYFLGSIGFIGIVLIVWTTNIPETLIQNMFLLRGGIFIGDVTVPIDLINWAMNYFFGLMLLVTGIITLPAVYAIYQLKEWGWKYTLLISMFWALFLFGLIVVWIFLKDEIKQFF